jgi:WD40 repeat protein
VAFSPDGRTLASASEDRAVILWEVATGERRGEPLIGPSAVLDVAFSPDGRTLASASFDNTVILWDVATGKPRGEPLAGHKNRVKGVAFSPDGTTLATASFDYSVILWDVDPSSLDTRATHRAGRNLTLWEWRKYIGPDIPYRRTSPEFPSGEGVTEAEPAGHGESEGAVTDCSE